MASEPAPPEYNHEALWEQTGLAAALAAFHSELPHIKKAAQSHHGKYADLAPVTHAILPKLAEHGLAWMCKPMLADGQLVMRYRLTHVATGQVEEGDYPLTGGNAQQRGSDITYARRYCLLAVTGVAPEGDDDDAAAASKAKAPRQQPRPESNGQPAAKPKDRNPAGLIAMHMQRLKVTDRAERLVKTSILAERTEPIESTNDLSDEKLEQVLDLLAKCKDRPALDRLLQAKREKVPAS